MIIYIVTVSRHALGTGDWERTSRFVVWIGLHTLLSIYSLPVLCLAQSIPVGSSLYIIPFLDTLPEINEHQSHTYWYFIMFIYRSIYVFSCPFTSKLTITSRNYGWSYNVEGILLGSYVRVPRYNVASRVTVWITTKQRCWLHHQVSLSVQFIGLAFESDCSFLVRVGLWWYFKACPMIAHS